MTSIENYSAGIKNSSPGVESSSSASIESVYTARIKSIAGPIIANILAT
jgi:hypothetical protein